MGHDIVVRDRTGKPVGWVSPATDSRKEYQLQIQEQQDAGLVIVVLLCIDKCEMTEEAHDAAEAAPDPSETAEAKRVEIPVRAIPQKFSVFDSALGDALDR